MGAKMIQKYLLEGLVGAFLLLFASWLVGYYANGLCGTHFDLASCWGFLSRLCGGQGLYEAYDRAIHFLSRLCGGQDPTNYLGHGTYFLSRLCGGQVLITGYS